MTKSSLYVLLFFVLLSCKPTERAISEPHNPTTIEEENPDNHPVLSSSPLTVIGTECEGHWLLADHVRMISHSQRHDREPDMCSKEPMRADGIVRLSKIEVYPEYLNEYIKQAIEVGEISLRTEPGVLTMYALSEKENPCRITILETYTSQEAYQKHIASAHFQRYKQGTLHMVKSLTLSDQRPLNPSNRIINFIQ